MVSQSEELRCESADDAFLDRFLEERMAALLPKQTEFESAAARGLFDFHDSPSLGAAEADLEESPETPANAGESLGPVVFWHLHPQSARGFSTPAIARLHRWLEHWHRHLSEDSYLMLAVPCDEDSLAKGSRVCMPSHRPSALRQTILLLSQHGFAVRREVTLEPDAFAAWAAEQRLKIPAVSGTGWHLISSHPDPFRVRSYCEGDETTILERFPKCFHVTRTHDHWRWKYRNNPFGETAISVAVSGRGELGAHYAGYAMPFYYGLGKDPHVFPALQMGDTMTHPLFRHIGGRSGLLARTVKHFFALHRGGPYGFFYGFNTGPIQRFCSWFIGGSRVEPVGFWSHRGTASTGLWRSAGYQVEPLQQAEDETDRLFRRLAPHYGFLVQRDARYLRWRYFDCPDTNYLVLAVRRWRRLVGWGVFRKHEGRLLWGDSLIHPRHRRCVGMLLTTAKEALGDDDETIEAWFSNRPAWWAEVLNGLGFERQPQPQGLGFMALPDGEQEATEHLQSLYYTMGDGDLF